MDTLLPGQEILEKSGEYPYTRGIHPDMYTKGRLPTVRKYGGFGTTGQLNEHLRKQIELGVTGLSIAYDLPTQMGYDPDDSLAFGEAGINGVSVACLEDYEKAFAGLFPTIIEKGIGVSKTINATAPILLAFYIAAAKKQGVDSKLLRGTIQNDVLKEYLARNTFIYPLEGTLRLVRDVFAYAKINLPKFNTISICGYHMREKGATAAQELAFMFANATQYVCVALEGGLSPDDLGPQISFFVNVKKDLFEETAKFRAARRIWAQIMREGFGAQSESAWKLRVQAYTGGSDLRAEKPQFNIVRDSVRTLAAVLSGPQGINTTSFDEAISIPSELSQAIAIDTPYIALYEKGLNQAADPLGGSRYLESKTQEIESEVWKELASIAKMPNYQKALKTMMSTIEAQAYQEQLAEDEGEKKVVGKNIAMENAKVYPPVEIFRPCIDPKSQKERVAAIARFKKTRNSSQALLSLERLEVRARSKEANLMEAIVEAVEAGATLGEISAALKNVFGSARNDEPWEPSKPVEVFNKQLREFVGEKAKKINPSPCPLPQGERVFVNFPLTTYDSRLTFHDFCVDAYSHRLKGATTAQELAWGLFEAAQMAKEKKLKKIILKLSSHNDFFEEISKFRVARKLWHEIAAPRLKSGLAMTTELLICAKTAEDTLTKQKPWNNIVRATLQAVQAILGGVDYLEIAPFDSPFRTYRLKDSRTSRLKTSWSPWAEQLVKDMCVGLVCEFGLTNVVDPCAGSYYLEELTVRLEKQVLEELAQINSFLNSQSSSRLTDLKTYGPKDLRKGLPGDLFKRYIRSQMGHEKAMDMKIVGVDIQIPGPSPKPGVTRRQKHAKKKNH